MGKFRFEGVDSNNKKIEGAVEAKDEKEARKLIRNQGVKIKKILAPTLLEFDFSQWMVDKGFAKSIDAKSLLNFTKQFSTMLGAGVPILQSLEILYRAEKNLTLKQAIKNIATMVGEGKTISEAMSEQRGFDKLYCNLVKAGESGGILDGILKKLATHLEKNEKTKAQIKGALTYPVIVTFVGIGVIWAMMVFVVPQFTSMLTDTGQEVPFITQLVIDASDFMGKYSLIMVPGAIVGLLFFLSFIKTPAGKIAWDTFVMKVPIFGGIVIKGNLSSFTNTLSTLLSSGVSLIDSLDICIETIDHTVIVKDLKEIKKKVLEGKTITEPIMKIHYFPELVSQMIRVGEQTGQVDQMLLRVSTVFEEEVDELISTMTRLIEPLIIVVLGGIIALILVAMYLPMFMSAGGQG